MVWVKFHDKLCEGAKRGLPRAVRFVFMELCLKARPGRGALSLPVGMSDIDALHDVLGGNRKEIADAIKALTTVPRPSPDDPEPRAMVELAGEEGARRLTIPSWEAWNSGHEAPGASTERSRRHRQRSTTSEPSSAQRGGNEAPNDKATSTQRPLHALRTGAQRIGNGGATQYRGEERREEKKREEEEILSPVATHAGSAMEPDGQLALPGTPEEAPSDPPKAPRRRREPTPPAPATEVRDFWRAEWTAAGMPGPAPWEAASASCAARYLSTPGATPQSAQDAILGLLRTDAGSWHRTTEGGRHATVAAALAGKNTVAFTAAGARWREAQVAAARPKRQPPPPDPVPEMYMRLAADDAARGVRLPIPAPKPPPPETA